MSARLDTRGTVIQNIQANSGRGTRDEHPPLAASATQPRQPPIQRATGSTTQPRPPPTQRATRSTPPPPPPPPPSQQGTGSIPPPHPPPTQQVTGSTSQPPIDPPRRSNRVNTQTIANVFRVNIEKKEKQIAKAKKKMLGRRGSDDLRNLACIVAVTHVILDEMPSRFCKLPVNTLNDLATIFTNEHYSFKATVRELENIYNDVTSLFQSKQWILVGLIPGNECFLEKAINSAIGSANPIGERDSQAVSAIFKEIRALNDELSTLQTDLHNLNPRNQN
ncbi:hypothetical protein CASFOL_031117 [Castilleja foliolosa]|uniref:Uncharacterized protein n=1 Tax=Castilleja foliolosa TaxID=1961234 RepID=A0ABD3C4F2_9LAMI